MEHVRALIAKWRDAAVWEHDDMSNVQAAQTFDQCADELEALLAAGEAAETPKQHGRDCPKVQHIGEGYLHSANDDRPYDVDGVMYCGRCHGWIGAAASLSPVVPTQEPATFDELIALHEAYRQALTTKDGETICAASDALWAWVRRAYNMAPSLSEPRPATATATPAPAPHPAPSQSAKSREPSAE